MKVLVIGSTGKTGQKLLEQLELTPHMVTGLIRSADQEDLIRQFGAASLLGDLENITDDLVKGFEVIIFVAGSGGKNIQGVDYQGLVDVVHAAEKAKLKRFLYIGSINTEKNPQQYIQEFKDFYANNNEVAPEGVLQNVQKPGYYDYVKIKNQAEDAIVNSSLNYTILRAGLLTQDKGSSKVSVKEGMLNSFGRVSRDNMAACFIDVLENEDTYHKIYTVLDGDCEIADAF
jgi:nucleoside-diphosphate-sugar epimerase